MPVLGRGSLKRSRKFQLQSNRTAGRNHAHPATIRISGWALVIACVVSTSSYGQFRNQVALIDVGFGTSALSVSEADREIEFSVVLSAPALTPASVWVATQRNSASPGSDFYGMSQRIDFAAGETRKQLRVELLDDTSPENTESFSLRLFKGTGLVVRQRNLVVTIQDDDRAGGSRLSVHANAANEADGNTRIQVRLQPAASTAVSVDLSTVAGTAVNRQDYYGIYSTLEFSPGETIKNTWLQIVDDATAETTEQLQARIFNARGAGISIASAAIVINDDDVNSPPSKGNGDIIGMFYGNPLDGDATGNSGQFRHSASRRFRAPRTGTVTAINFNNRVLHQANIDNRASGDNIWAQCKNGGLDKYTCGYILPNSYSLGNGGLIQVELREDDGSAQHLPSDTVLAKTIQYVPMELEEQEFPVFELDRRVAIEGGKIYHLVHRQLNPPLCNKGRTVEQARNCDRDRGLVGFNGLHYHSGRVANSPFGGETEAILIRNSSTDNWRRDPNNLSWYGLRFDDGLWFGHMLAYYKGADTGEGGGNRFVGGDAQGRQLFTVTDRNYQVDGVWVRVDRTSATTQPLTVQLNSGANTLASASISASAVIARCDTDCSGSWVFTDLSSTVNLQQGQTYSLEFTAATGARYSLQSGFQLDYAPFKMADEQTGAGWWRRAKAQFSADGGNSWGPWSTNNGRSYKDNRDLSVLFTLSGQPRQLR